MKTISLENIHTSIASNSLVEELIEKVGENAFIFGKLAKELNEEMEGKILSRYYTESAIQERKEAERIAKIEKRKNEVIKTFEKRINKATKEKDVKLAILGAGLLSDNYIYYVEGNNVVFNYYSYHDKVTEEEYNNMLKNIDYSLLPEGIKFEFK